MENTILILIALSVLAIVVIILASRRGRSSNNAARIAALEERIAGMNAEKVRLETETARLHGENRTLRDALETRSNSIANLERQVAVSIKELEGERKNHEENIRLLKEAKEELGNQFKILASSILEEKTRVFAERNKSGLNEILNPLKERLGEFQKKIQENYETEGKERHTLQNEVRKLMEMNDRLSKEASNLVNALKGENKTQGSWGEMILERILEVSGLRKGEEYTVQESYIDAAGNRVQPDVIIHLPDKRYMIIDSKMSLNAYDAYANGETAEEQAQALKAHIASLRNHIKGLSGKEYHKLHGDQSPDFVVMFIPVEPAFMLAIAEDGRLWEDAWKSNVLLVSSSTLLFVMRIVAQLWRQEMRSRNAQDIANRGAALYDKLVGFVEDFESVGVQIARAEKSFENAKGKLTAGQGNVIRQAQMLKKLGIESRKQLPENYVELEEDPFSLQHPSEGMPR